MFQNAYAMPVTRGQQLIFMGQAAPPGNPYMAATEEFLSNIFDFLGYSAFVTVVNGYWLPRQLLKKVSISLIGMNRYADSKIAEGKESELDIPDPTSGISFRQARTNLIAFSNILQNSWTGTKVNYKGYQINLSDISDASYRVAAMHGLALKTKDIRITNLETGEFTVVDRDNSAELSSLGKTPEANVLFDFTESPMAWDVEWSQMIAAETQNLVGTARGLGGSKITLGVAGYGAALSGLLLSIVGMLRAVFTSTIFKTVFAVFLATALGIAIVAFFYSRATQWVTPNPPPAPAPVVIPDPNDPTKKIVVFPPAQVTKDWTEYIFPVAIVGITGLILYNALIKD